ncbi:Predicted Zn-dependent protease or its inactivated homolog [Chitinophaga costaii]|uniref:Predicted Zn-dependent protease or its inactivated homolog n=1 Tax=Chitinophaga costaii TaxID=1335309 RepID=A0A1C4FBQ5_9BACT|nr:TldD/PmbA family protein [Chitinophaga costaii]PUZ20710.1 TldD/PmbA family protein [Chitinophaga costaii]SCC53302.1 Predicted Zn-dependent protease or its inactivated homolog [Chitinophaga costaii]
MPILSKEQAETLLKKVLHYSTADECQVSLYGSDAGNIRYARNAASTSGGVSLTQLAVSSTFGKRNGIATINEYDDASLEKVVRRAEELAKLAPENPEYISILGPQEYADSVTFVPATAAVDPKYRADAVQQSLQISKDNKLTTAGFLENSTGFNALMNSKGLFAYNAATNINFNVTMRTADGQGSGYATKGYNDASKLDVAAVSRYAASKATSAANAKAIEPGKYTVILEPAAGIVLLENLYFGLDARQADEGRSFLSKTGGKTRLGEKLVDERVNIYSDPHYPELPTATWSDDGRPLEKTTWIENGVVKNLAYSRYWAEKQKVKAVPQGNGFIMDGGTASLEELIKDTEKGILVTRLWYIRPVDPQTLLYTGLTRDGTFYIENGEIKYPVKNLRFNESPVIMLNNLEALGKPERTVSGETNMHAIVPPLKLREFTFTSLSDAI